MGCTSSFQCTSCFGVFINVPYRVARLRLRVSMHFVLWGLHQLGAGCQHSTRLCFNALRALGSSSTRCFAWWFFGAASFNALRALGSSSTLLRSRKVIVPCFNALRALGSSSTKRIAVTRSNLRFNALRALGSSSTLSFLLVTPSANVSMHFVLWGLHQHNKETRNA